MGLPALTGFFTSEGWNQWKLERLHLPWEDRLIQVVVEDWIPAFPAGNLVIVHQGDEEWTESVKRADAVILVGGVGGTWTTGEFGLTFGRAVFPLAETGGDAAKFYRHMLRTWKPEFVPGSDKTKFQIAGREATGRKGKRRDPFFIRSRILIGVTI